MFNLFKFKKSPVIEDVVAKEPGPALMPLDVQQQEVVPAEAVAMVSQVEVTEPESGQAPGQALEPLPDAASSLPGQVPDQPTEPMPDAAANSSELMPRQADEPTPEIAASLPGQMDTMKSTREDVIAAYKIFLGRLPESMDVVHPRVGVSPAALLVDFLVSKEFLDQAPKSQLVLAVAKKILDERKQASATEGAAPGAEAAAP